jgi:anti-anti-sigma regulatory factor
MEQVTMKSALQNNDWVISSGERLTIETITDYVQLIRTGLAEADTVILEFDPEVDMDITALQAFCSACKTASASGKRCIHRGPSPKALIELVAAVGAERHNSCGNHNESCFREFGGANTWEN